MSRLGQAVLHAEGPTDAGKTVPAWKPLVELERERHTVAAQYDTRLKRPRSQYSTQKVSGCHTRSMRLQLGKGDFASMVYGHEEVPEVFFGLYFGKVDGQVADGVVLELFFGTAWLSSVRSSRLTPWR